ncbi:MULTISPECIES: hypothetical protein [Nostoc cyanobionts]|uniref:hypothetical protein n=1 Tax=Nostoc cyanobionts TaxID=3123326 RepID=UPI00117F1996|nr:MULTISPECIES: hypothetical protein [unclassified Nostoc]
MSEISYHLPYRLCSKISKRKFWHWSNGDRQQHEYRLYTRRHRLLFSTRGCANETLREQQLISHSINGNYFV